jgi:2-C-methyl-D-erythritol 4-phosphate cytidylyltransferase
MPIALIVAAGRGERLGSERPKALVELAGRPLVQWSIDVLRQVQGIERIVVALPPGIAGSAEMATVAGGATQGVAGGLVRAVSGGAVRSESVRLALAAAGPGDPVLVHDAARPLLTGELVAATIAALEQDLTVDAAIAAVPVTDTVKRVEGGVVSETLDRRALWAVQTPQVFRREALERALDVSREVLAQATDDAWLVERAGGRVAVVRGSEENLKVTGALDLRVAEMLLRARAG